jgi:hypothetical protein
VDESPKPGDTNTVDVQPGEVQKPVDVGQPDKAPDAPKPLDVQPAEAGQTVDGGLDTGSIG